MTVGKVFCFLVVVVLLGLQIWLIFKVIDCGINHKSERNNSETSIIQNTPITDSNVLQKIVEIKIDYSDADFNDSISNIASFYIEEGTNIRNLIEGNCLESWARECENLKSILNTTIKEWIKKTIWMYVQ